MLTPPRALRLITLIGDDFHQAGLMAIRRPGLAPCFGAGADSDGPASRRKANCHPARISPLHVIGDVAWG